MILYQLKYILRKLAGKERGIYLSATINGKRKYHTTGKSVLPHLWDSKLQRVKEAHPQCDSLNIHLQSYKADLIYIINQAQLKGQNTVNLRHTAKEHNIFHFVEGWIIELQGTKGKKQSTLKGWQTKLNKLESFSGRSITFEDIDRDFLARYEAFIKDPEKTKARISNSTYIESLWRVLKTWFNEARRRGITTNYPFLIYNNPKGEVGEKDYLNVRELKKMERYVNEPSSLFRESTIYFLFGCYTGLRISDWYLFDKKKNISEGRLVLRTKKNRERVTMVISAPLKRILNMMHGLNVKEVNLNEHLKAIAKKLNINKHLTTHSGRKTFAVELCANRGISSETCATLMGITVNTCVKSYYRVTSIKIDKETEKAWRF